MRIIAFYLPQFHSIPENDEWWGKGFTEWTNMKAARPLFDGHRQPRIPLDNNYYNLLDNSIIKWQTELAKKYGVYGFCFYHYWFDGHMLLQKPMENMREDKEINFPYCICWANEGWTNAWKSDSNAKVLISQRYGNKKEWKEHFEYLLPFFKDENYIIENGKPLFVLYRPEICDCLNEMLEYWDSLARENGFDGMCYAYQQVSYYLKNDRDESHFDYRIEYQPGYARYDSQISSGIISSKWLKLKNNIRYIVGKVDSKVGTNFLSSLTKQGLSYEDYSTLCESIINRHGEDEKSVAGMFVDWDNTPRRGKRGRVCRGSNPDTFKYYMSKQIKNVKDTYKNDMLFVFAWNEWAEGGYLEPDMDNEYGYLKALKCALEENGE